MQPGSFALCRKSIRSRLNISLPGLVMLRVIATVESGPLGLFLKEAHGIDVLFAERKEKLAQQSPTPYTNKTVR